MNMVTCPECRISFNAADAWCPLCRRYEAPLMDRLHALANRATALLEEGESPQQVARLLNDADVPSEFVDQLMALCRRKVARRERAAGVRRMLAGFGCLLFAVLILLGGFFPGSVLSFLFGVVAIISGAWSFLTGSADVPPAPEWANKLDLN